MKKLFVLLLTSFTTYSQAQMKVGANAGYVLSNLIDREGQTFDTEELKGEVTSQSGWYLGISFENTASEKIAIQFEGNYALLGGMLEAHFKDLGAGFLSRINIHQLLFPVSVKYYPIKRWNISGGAYLGFKIKANARFDQYYGLGSMTNYNAHKEAQKKLGKQINTQLRNESLGLFAGSEYQLGKRLSLHAKYNFGISNLAVNKKENLKVQFLQTGIKYNLN